MTEANTRDVFLPACPGGYWLKVIHNQIIALNRKAIDFIQEIARSVLHKSSVEIDATPLTKKKLKPFDVYLTG